MWKQGGGVIKDSGLTEVRVFSTWIAVVRALETRERVAAGFAPLTKMQAQMLVEYVVEIT